MSNQERTQGDLPSDFKDNIKYRHKDKHEKTISNTSTKTKRQTLRQRQRKVLLSTSSHLKYDHFDHQALMNDQSNNLLPRIRSR